MKKLIAVMLSLMLAAGVLPLAILAEGEELPTAAENPATVEAAADESTAEPTGEPEAEEAASDKDAEAASDAENEAIPETGGRFGF